MNFDKAPLHRLELCSPAPEADTLSTELQGQATRFYHIKNRSAPTRVAPRRHTNETRMSLHVRLSCSAGSLAKTVIRLLRVAQAVPVPPAIFQ